MHSLFSGGVARERIPLPTILILPSRDQVISKSPFSTDPLIHISEYPTLRSFTLLPGVIQTPMVTDRFVKFALDHADLTGMLALYLSTSRADFLRGGLMSVNWDIEETEAHKDEILRGRLLDLKWVQILPVGGGKGFE